MVGRISMGERVVKHETMLAACVCLWPRVRREAESMLQKVTRRATAGERALDSVSPSQNIVYAPNR